MAGKLDLAINYVILDSYRISWGRNRKGETGKKRVPFHCQ